MNSQPLGTNDLLELSNWLGQLPGQIDYEAENGAVSRQAFLDQVAEIIGPQATVAIYLRDMDDSADFLTLAYARKNFPKLKAPKTISLNPSGSSGSKEFHDDALSACVPDDRGKAMLLYALCAHRVRSLVDRVLSAEEFGIAVVVPDGVSAPHPMMRLKLNIALRLFAIETSRSRQRRLAAAVERMLGAVRDGVDPDALCSIIQTYCRAHSVLIYERRGLKYELCGKCFSAASANVKPPSEIASDEVARLTASGKIARNHTVEFDLPEPIRILAHGGAWMAVPCETVGLDMSTGENGRYPQFLIILAGKDNIEYLGRDYSQTDLEIARKLVSLLSNHLPYLDLSVEIGELYKEFDGRQLGEFDLKWFANLAIKYVPGLLSLGVFPDYPSSEGATFEGAPFQASERKGQGVRLARPFQVAEGMIEPQEGVYLLIFHIKTQYRADQKLAFAFSDRFIQDAQIQILDALVEYARSEFSVTDFREYHIATQAQIRHVVRGSLSAAISELELFESRMRLYTNLPTKLQRLLETPTMQSGMADALLWLSEVYSLVDAPRYLLETFDASAIRWSDVSPTAIIRAVLNVCKGEIRRRGLRVDIQSVEECDGMLVSADGEFLKIVIFNLIDNALKYSFQDRWIKVSLIFTQYRWRFEIENIGVPIRPEDKKRIWHPWVRSFRQYLANRRPGTGLGLAVSQRILAAHDPGMMLDCESEQIGDKPPTARTTFFFEMDLKGKREAAS